MLNIRNLSTLLHTKKLTKRVKDYFIFSLFKHSTGTGLLLCFISNVFLDSYTLLKKSNLSIIVCLYVYCYWSALILLYKYRTIIVIEYWWLIIVLEILEKILILCTKCYSNKEIPIWSSMKAVFVDAVKINPLKMIRVVSIHL